MSKYFQQITKQYETKQIHKPFNRREAQKKWRKVIAPTIGYIQIDLADFKKYKSPRNKNIRYAFFILDVYSRFLWIIPLTGREQLHKPFIKWYTENNGNKWIKTITSDREFITKGFEDFLKNKKIKVYYNYAHDKHNTSVVERSIRSMRNIIKFYTSSHNTSKYIDALQNLVDLYNNTEHGTTGKTPKEVFYGEAKPKHIYQKWVKPIPIGSYVRILSDTNVFKKSDDAVWSHKIYVVVRPYRYRYIVKDLETEIEKRKAYAPHQLQVIPKNTIKPKKQRKEDEIRKIKKKDTFKRKMAKTNLAPIKEIKTGKRQIPKKEHKYKKFEHWTTTYQNHGLKYDVILLESKSKGNIKVIATDFDEVDKKTKKRFPSVFDMPTSKLIENKRTKMSKKSPKMGIEARKFLNKKGYWSV